MKTYKILFVFGLCLLTLNGAAKLSAIFSQGKFYRGNNSFHTESYIVINGNSVKPVLNGNKKYQGKLTIECTVKSGDSLFYYNKYNLLSPEADSSHQVQNFIEQINIPLHIGSYQFTLNIIDANDNTQSFEIIQPFNLTAPDQQYLMSNIQLVENFSTVETDNKFSKNNLQLIPYPDNYIPETIDTLKFYAELYNTIPNDSDILIRYYLLTKGKNEVIDNLIGYKKIKGNELNAVAGALPISNVYSGNYILVVEARTRNNEYITASNYPIMRSKRNFANDQIVPTEYALLDIKGSWIEQITDTDTLKMYADCLYPIGGRLENIIANNQVTAADKISLQKYILHFWKKRDAKNSEKAWLEYKHQVDLVNKAYGVWNTRGYETDRGRVYLQYGPPNKMAKRSIDEPLAYPYEIWHYYQLKEEGNRKFVFYTTEIASNDYKLLHSDARGEIQESNWETKLVERSQNFGNDYDNKKSNNYFGKKTGEDFSLPK